MRLGDLEILLGPAADPALLPVGSVVTASGAVLPVASEIFSPGSTVVCACSANAAVNPSAIEVCNGLDDDCDGTVDDNPLCPAYYACVHGVCVPDPCGGELAKPRGAAVGQALAQHSRVGAEEPLVLLVRHVVDVPPQGLAPRTRERALEAMAVLRLDDVPPGVVTVTSTTPTAWAGETAVIEVGLFTVTLVAARSPNSGCALRPVPTAVPPIASSSRPSTNKRRPASVGSRPADVITVFEHLQSLGKADEVGGLAYLNSLAQYVPSASNIRRYAEIVRETARLRAVIRVGSRLVSAAHLREASAADVVEEAVRALLAELSAELERAESTAAPEWPLSVDPIERIGDRLSRAWGTVGHLMGVKNSPELRKAHDEVQPEVVAFSMRMSQSKPLYRAFKALRDGARFASLDPAQQRIVTSLVRDAELAGVGLEGDTWPQRPSDRSPDGGPSKQAMVTVMNSRAIDLVAFIRELVEQHAAIKLPDTKRQMVYGRLVRRLRELGAGRRAARAMKQYLGIRDTDLPYGGDGRDGGNRLFGIDLRERNFARVRIAAATQS